MPFTASWRTLLDECDALAADATLITPLSDDRFSITDVQEHRLIIEFTESDDSQPLQRDQFETLAEQIADADGTFELHRFLKIGFVFSIKSSIFSNQFSCQLYRS